MRLHHQVVEINLARNDISTLGAAALSQLLRLHSSVKGLNLHENSINDIGAAALARMLVSNSCLHALRLSGNLLTDQGALSLVEGVLRNTALQAVTLEREPVMVHELKGAGVGGRLDLSMRGYGRLSAVLIAKLIEGWAPDVDKLVLDRCGCTHTLLAVTHTLC